MMVEFVPKGGYSWVYDLSNDAWNGFACIEGVLGGSGSIFRFKQRKVHQKLAKQARGTAFWERLPHNLG